MKKAKTSVMIILAIILKIMLTVSFFVWFCNVDAFWNYPLQKDVMVKVDFDDVVFYYELNEPPQYVIEDFGRCWFGDSFAPIAIRKLEKYMKKNNLCILPGEYVADSCYRIDDLIELLNFDDADKYLH